MDSTSRWLVGSSKTRTLAAGQRHHREGDARQLAAGERAGAAQGLVAGEIEPAQVIHHLPAGPRGPEVVDDVEQGLVARHLGQILAIGRDAGRLAQPDARRPAARAHRAGWRAGCSCRRRWGRPGPATSPRRTDAEKPSSSTRSPTATRSRSGDQHLVAAAAGGAEAHRHGAVVAGRRREPRHAHQPAAAALGLAWSSGRRCCAG